MPSYDHVSHHRDEPQQHVGRFDCNICLESVSDDPVVTQCGHLYCWPCLFTWLEPGLTIEEKRHLGIPLNGSNRASSTTNNNDDGQNADFPFDDAAIRAQTFLIDFIRNTRRIHELQQGLTGVRDNTNTTARTNNGNGTRAAVSPRSCCPTCKAPCSVLNIIPLYVRHSDDDDNMNDSLAEPVSACAPATTSEKRKPERNDNDVDLDDDDDDVGYESNTPLEMEDADVSQGVATSGSTDFGLRRRRPTSSSDSTEGTSNVVLDTTTTHLNRLLRNNGGVPPRPSAPSSASSSSAFNTTSSNRVSVGVGGSFQEQQSATTSSFYPPRPPAPGSLQMVQQQQQQQRNGGGTTPTSGSLDQQSSSTATGSFFITSGPFRLVSLPTATTTSNNNGQGVSTSSGTGPNQSQNNNNNNHGDGQQQLPVDSNSNYLHQDHEGRMIPFFNNNDHSSADHRETSTQQIEDATTEFLSRLMLMLGSFVLLVLLLF